MLSTERGSSQGQIIMFTRPAPRQKKSSYIPSTWDFSGTNPAIPFIGIPMTASSSCLSEEENARWKQVDGSIMQAEGR